MNEVLINRIKDAIEEKAGVKLKGSMDPTGDRDGLVFWLENYTRGSGPTFSLKPAGLKRIKVGLKFGAYSRECIDHINTERNEEAFQLLAYFMDELSKKYNVTKNIGDLSSFTVHENFQLEVVARIKDQKSAEEIMKTSLDILPMMVGGIVEIIGYDCINEVEEFAVEGDEKTVVYKRRERNKRNRLLCLQIHGRKCKVCGFESSDIYSDLPYEIIEVHHVEPLSELEAARAYDPRYDLIPLCPNCHRAIHVTKPAMKPEELSRRLK